MRATALSLSNVQYAALKHKKGVHNWGFISPQQNNDYAFDFDMNELEEIIGETPLLEALASTEAEE